MGEGGKERAREGRIVWGFLLASAALTLWFYRDFVFHPERLMFGSDMLLEGFPLRQFAVDEVRAGRGIPLWTPHVYAGMPYVALLPGPIFYPTTLLYFVLPLYRAIGWTFVLHTFLSGAFGVFLGRSFRLRPWAAVVCGASFLFTGYVTSHLFGGQDGRMFAMTLIPLALGCLERGLSTGEWRWFAGLALAIGLQVLTPHTQVMYFSTLALATYAILRVALPTPSSPSETPGRGVESSPAADAPPAPSRSSRGVEAAAGGWWLRTRPLAMFAAAVAGAAAIGAIQLLPTLSLLDHVTRAATERGYAFAASYALPVQELSALFLPDLIGSVDTYWGSNPLKLHTEYLGAVPVALALLAVAAIRGTALSSRQRRTVALVAALAVVGVLFALGAATPVHRIAYALVPMIASFRAPAMMMGPVAVFVALLAAFGWEAVLAARERGGNETPASWILWGGLSLPFIGLGLGAALGPDGLLSWAQVAWYPDGALRQPAPPLSDSLRVGGWVLLAGFGTVGAIGWSVSRSRVHEIAIVAVLALAVADLWRVDARYLAVVDASRVLPEGDPIVETLRAEAGPGERIWAIQREDPGFRENQFMYWGLSSATGSQKFLLRPYARLIGGIRADFGLESNPAVLIPLLDVRYLIGRAEQAPQAFDLLAESGGRRLYRIRTGVPHAYFPARVEAVPDTAEAVRRTRANTDPLALAIVESGDGSPTGPSSAPRSSAGGGMPTAGSGSASVERYEPDAIELAVRADAPGLLVVSEIHHPGWRAWVDDEEVPVWRTNVALRGVEVPAGEHRVRFEYRSPAYAAGRAITLVAALALAALFGVATWRSRRRRT